MTFKAFSLTNEIHLNNIAIQCGIPRKYTWEQPLILNAPTLTKILNQNVDAAQSILVFSFGSVVFINFEQIQDMLPFLNFLKNYELDIHLKNISRYSDDYSLHIMESEDIQMTDEFAIAPHYEAFYPEIISTVLAKSVALEKSEEQLGRILDQLEGIIDRLERGNLRVGNKALARTQARILRHEYNTLAYIMILDKPEITWTNSSAGEFYDQMMDFFELNDRYKILKSKTDILYTIMDGFSSISHSIRGLFVEWIVVFLIVLEILLTVFEILGFLPHT
ncbi:RMD1 family protein [Pullulanibacillus sp. KACC 23026]|uniref:RMD1 family protein n=1 Tax=Pullulanibacillus sp. KACC 23026 TaxID=3028315 RepID=UPI0023AE9ED4|nr:RMD1 family protein [Pullulanibacillus sp. KACC 23026]WEG14943.1 RMD1 family protein [Pullulanibacillus sp. KACC 23026]